MYKYTGNVLKSTSLVIRKIKIKFILKSPFIPVKTATIQEKNKYKNKQSSASIVEIIIKISYKLLY